MQTKHLLIYLAIATINAMLSSLVTQLVLHNVPFPLEWSWISPVLVSGFTMLTMLLPKLLPTDTVITTTTPNTTTIVTTTLPPTTTTTTTEPVNIILKS